MSQLWQKLEKAFERCHDLDSQARAAYLAALEQDDPELYLELQKLLDADDLAAADSFFDPASLHSVALLEDHFVGKEIGPFTLTRLIGEGGMGAVYLAEQSKPIKRRVAIKVIRVHTTNERLQRRFELEVQTLARLNHPNIASVYFSGTTDNGLPFFAMEYVEGAPLGDYCRAHQLDLRQRLALFSAICRAVHFAHQRGIIHRDLKPANILVTTIDTVPQPKIIDFGIAKAVQSDDQLEHSFQVTATQLTIPGVAVGTLGYMSPEQTRVQDRDIDLRTDVYSLGVILYEMLVGDLPLSRQSLEALSWDQTFQAIRESQPKNPSRAVLLSNADRENLAGEPAQLSKRYRGDLDWITIKAIEKEPARRYESALALAEDCDRHLADEPVLAGPPSWTYQAGRFIKRNRLLTTAVATVVAGVLVALVGLSIGFYQSKQAEQRILKEAETAKTTVALLEEFITAVSPQNEGKDVKVIDRLHEFSPKINQLALNDEIRGNLHHMVGKAYRTVSAFEPSRDHLDAAVRLRSAVYGEDALQTLESRYEACLTRNNLVSRPEALQCFQNLLADFPPTQENFAMIGNLHALSAGILIEMKHYPQAEETLAGLAALLETYPNSNPRLQLKYHNAMALFLTYKRRYDAAAEHLTQALAKNDHSSENIAYMIDSKLYLANILSQQGKLREANQLLKETHADAVAYYGEDHPETLKVYVMDGHLCLRQGRFYKLLNRAGTMWPRFTSNRDIKNLDLYNFFHTARIASAATGQDDLFLPLFSSYFDRTYNDQAPSLLEARQLNMFASLLIGTKDYQAAEAVAHTAWEISAANNHAALTVAADIANNICTIYYKLEQHERAVPWGCAAVAYAEQAYGRHYDLTMTYAFRWVVALVESDFPEGAAELDAFIEEAEAFWGGTHGNTLALKGFREEQHDHLLRKNKKGED